LDQPEIRNYNGRCQWTTILFTISLIGKTKKVRAPADTAAIQSRTTEEEVGDIIQQDMKSLQLKKEHTSDQKKWRKDPSG